MHFNKTYKLINKKNVCLLILWMICMQSFQVNAQETVLSRPVSVTFNETLYNALLSLGNKIGYYFSYNAEIIDTKKEINLTADNQPVKIILDRMLQDSTLSYRVIQNLIVIYRPVVTKIYNPDSVTSKKTTYLRLTGKIVESQSGDPVVYAGVGLLGRSYGTISNEDGEFVLKVPTKDIGDTLGITSMGYETKKIPVYQLLGNELTIRLQTDLIPIQEVIIRRTDPEILLRKAIEKINDNYSEKPAILTGFYRESVKKRNTFVMVSEAVLDMYKSAYNNKYESDQIKIVKARKSLDHQRADTVSVTLRAGLQTSLLLDIVKNPPDFLNQNNFQEYKYRMADIVSNGDKSTYVIDFDPAKPDAMYKGKIYLDLESLAFSGAEFSLSNEVLRRNSQILVVKKPRHYKVSTLKATYMVSYKETNGKYYMNYLRSETEFRIRKKGNLFASTYELISEMAVTGIDTVNVERFKTKETARLNTAFTEQLGEYDETFWDQYNYIKPDESLTEALKRISEDNSENR